MSESLTVALRAAGPINFRVRRSVYGAPIQEQQGDCSVKFGDGCYLTPSWRLTSGPEYEDCDLVRRLVRDALLPPIGC